MKYGQKINYAPKKLARYNKKSVTDSEVDNWDYPENKTVEFPGLDRFVQTGNVGLGYWGEEPPSKWEQGRIENVAIGNLVKKDNLERPTIAAIPMYPKKNHPKSFIFPTRSTGEVEKAMKDLGYSYGTYKVLPVPLVLPEEIPYDGNDY